MSKVIAITNQKGGVGKTTTSVNLSAALAKMNYKVLLIDMDPQANATQGIGIDRDYIELSTYHVLTGEVGLEKVIQHSYIENLDVAPGEIDLAGIDLELAHVKQGREVRLKQSLDKIKDYYDFVFIDCPPALGLLNTNALTSCDTVLIPVQCEYYALEGLTQLLNTIKLTQNHFNKKLSIEGLLLTMLDQRTNLGLDVSQEVRKYFKEKTMTYGRSLGIIPAKNYFNFLQDIGNFRLEFNTEKENIIRNIEEVIANARAANGDLFDRNNYPSIAELEANIYFSIEANPVPATNDYDKLADLTPEEIELLKKEAVLSNQSKLESAMQDLFGRLMKGLIHAAERLKDDDNGEMQIFRDSLIGNIGKAVEAAETLNIEDNDQLQQFTDKIKDVFDGLSAQELRTNSQLRKETAAKAADIAQKMSELF